MNKEASIPLRSPGGVVYAWACGTCHHVRAGIERLVCLTPEDIHHFAEWSKGDADSCCTCRSCGGRMPRGESGTLGATRCHDCEERERPAEEARLARMEKENAAFAARAEAALAKTKDPEAAEELVAMMSDKSEECYCAGWHSGIEFMLWEMLQEQEADRPPSPYRQGGRREFGLGGIGDEEFVRLRELHEKAGGWWRWENDEGTICAGGTVFVTTEEWKAIVAGKGKQGER